MFNPNGAILFGGQGFDSTNIVPRAVPVPVPADAYTAAIIGSELSPTEGGGQRLALCLRILEGPYKDKLLFDGLNLANASAQAVDIAFGTLSAITHATGVLRPQSSGQLHNIPLRAIVTLKPAGNDKNGVWREARNEVKGYESVAGSAATPSTGANAWAAPGVVAPPVNAWGQQPQQQVAPPAAAVAPPPVAAAPPAPAPAPAAPVFVMTAAANGLTREQYLQAGWTDAQIMTAGFMVQQVPAPAAPLVTPAPAMIAPPPGAQQPPVWARGPQP